jgi:MFS family permease
MLSLLIGPVIGPVAGGGLSDAFGWRSTMICLAAFGGLAALVIAVCVPETHQYLVLQRLAKQDPDSADGIQEKEAIEGEPPVFHAPWVPLRYLIEPSIAPHSTAAFITFGVNLAALTEIPAALASPPYALTAAIIGVVFLSDGVSGLIGSPLGGWMSDKAAAVNPGVPEARLASTTLCTLLIMPAGLLIYGWSVQFTAHLAALIVALFLMGGACAVCLPRVFGYLTTLKQSAAGAASAAVQTSMFVSAAVFILVSSVAVKAMGAGPWFTVLAALEVSVTGVAYLQIWRKKRRAAAAAAAAAAAV